jgi:hypothetical protein
MLSVVNTNSNFAYHTIANAEFTAAFIRVINNDLTSFYKYHLFIKYGEKVYIEVDGFREIVLTIAELQQDRYLRFYYELSQMLTNDKHLVVEDLVYNSDSCSSGSDAEDQIYKEPRRWSPNTAFIEKDIHNDSITVLGYSENAYYKINPYLLEDMDYSTHEDLHNFRAAYMTTYEDENMLGIYYNLALEYQASLLQNKFEEIL